MLFNSFDFAVFLPVTFLLYWFAFRQSLRLQNAFVVAASYLFYGWWDWRFLSLIAISSITDYLIGLGLGRVERPGGRKTLLLVSLGVNLGLLGFFKYFNFFTESFADTFSLFGASFEPSRLSIVLPVGISFYTFQTLSYTIDIYRRRLQPTKDLIAFLSFVSFFPQLVAGPIERASNLLPQFLQRREFRYHTAVAGLRQILWGLFKKIVVADCCADYANWIFANYQDYGASTLVLGVLYFAFQIYCDFSGYSDIAIGTAKLFGFRLATNFRLPYFSRNVGEFWRRWHISLSTWFRDYVYIPLGGSRGPLWRVLRNVTVVFVLCGLWHGANWTFVVWGVINAAYFIPLVLFGTNRNHLDTVAKGRTLPTLRDLLSMGSTFALICVGWVFFRAESLAHALGYLNRMLSDSILSRPMLLRYVPLVALLVTIEWLQRERDNPLDIPSAWLRRVAYLGVCAMLVTFGKYLDVKEFVYFQF